MTLITQDSSPLELAATISQTLEDAGLSAVLSGGAAVSIYSGGTYESSDLDFVSSEQISEWDQLQTDRGVIQILSPTQMIMDRLAAFIHWNDPPSLDQAGLVAQKHPLDWEFLENWVSKEGGQEKYEIFRRALVQR